MPKPMYVWTGTAWVSVASEVESLATYATQSYADAQPGMKLVVPTSVAVGSGSGSVATQGTVSFSGASSVSLNNVFNTNFDNYLIYIDTTSSNDGIGLAFRLRVNGTDAATNYNEQYHTIDGTSATGAARATSQTSTNIGILGSGSRNLLVANVSGPFLTRITTGYCTGVSSFNSVYQRNYYFMNTNATSYDGFTIYPSTGNITGNVNVYGYKKG